MSNNISKTQLYWYDSENKLFKPISKDGENSELFIPKVELYWYDKENDAYKPLITDGKMPINEDIIDSVTQNVKGDIEEVTAQLAQTVKQGESGVVTWAMAAQDFREQITGGNTAVVGVDAVLEPNIVNGAVSPIKTNFFKKSKNLFDKSVANLGKVVSPTYGTLSDSATYHTTDYIPVLPNTEYTRSYDNRTAFYDADKVFISGFTTAGSLTVTTPENATFIRCSFQQSMLDTFQMELGGVATTYEPYRMYIGKEMLEEPDFNIEKVPDNIFPIKKTTFATIGKNLFDKDAAVSGYVNQTNGQIVESATSTTSDFIEIEPNTPYTRSYDGRTAFYDEYKKFISGHYDSSGNTKTLITPANAKYMRCTTLTSRVSIFQIEKGNQETFYEPHLYEFKKSKETFFKPEITLPPTIYAVVGKEVNIYFDNVLNDKADKFEFDVICSVGDQQNERWTYIPSSEGNYPLTIHVYKDNLIVASATTNITVKGASVGTGINKKCIFIGDSTTNAGIYQQELINLFDADVMDVTLLGTRGTAPALHEGRSGWTTTIYLNDAINTGVTNAFYNNGFDFSYYMTQQSYTDVDYVFIHLGINDIFLPDTDMDIDAKIPSILANFQTMIDSIKSFNVNIKVGLMITIPPASNQDAFGASYNSGKTRARHKRNHYLFTKALIGQFKDKEGQGIYLVPINVNLDTVNNFPSALVPVNSRNDKQVTRQINGVHPDSSGYYQMADSVYYFLKGQES